ncbi:MAG: DUF389 domain-containing protein [Candidatus Pacebacteria bacterium]|nr:DUF389 domain-containing protein [Candidatus Paceibacterota bacterium]
MDNSGPKASKETIINKIKDQSKFSFTYFLLLITSTIIATLGLLTNNSSVVIGAMLIAPVFWPVLGISLGAVRNDHNVLVTTITSLFLSILVVLFISSGLTIILPFEDLSLEIISRTQPTLIHLFIALTSSVIGIAALYYKKISSSASGAAISIALLPPLCVTGIGLATQSWSTFFGAGMLFITSTIAIIFAGIISLYIFKVRPYFKKDKNIALTSLAISFVLLIALSIPLTLYLKLAVDQSKIKNQIHTIIDNNIMEINPKAQAKNITIIFPNIYDSKHIDIEATLYIPESETFDISNQQLILNRLSEKIEQPTDLKLNIIETVEIHKNGDDNVILKNQISQLINEYLSDIDIPNQINKIDLIKNSDQSIYVSIQILYTDQIPITFDNKQELEVLINKETGLETKLDIHLISAESIKMKAITSTNKEDIKNLFFDKYKAIINVNLIKINNSEDNIPVEVIVNLTATDKLNISPKEKEDLKGQIQKIIKSTELPELSVEVNVIDLY